MSQTPQSLCTVVVALKGRSYWTSEFLNLSVHGELEYLFLDGSLDDSNEVIFKEELGPNIQYIRYPPDANISVYMDKMLDGITHVSTPYVIFADNDDFIVLDGVLKSCDILECDRSAVVSGGVIAGLSSSFPNGRRCSLPVLYSNPLSLNRTTGLNTVNRLRRRHVSLWNMVYRRDVFAGALQRARELDVKELHLMEFVVTDSALAQGECKFHQKVHYVRTEQQTDREVHTTQVPSGWEVGNEHWLEAHSRIFESSGDSVLAGPDYRIALWENSVSYSFRTRIARSVRYRLLRVRWLSTRRVLAYLRFLPPVPLPRFPQPLDG